MYIKLFVTPNAKRESVVTRTAKKPEEEMLVITVREKAEGNRANLRVREIIAERYAVPLGKVRILTGHRSRVKMVSIST